MFQNTIRTTPLTDNVSDSFFAGKIEGDSVRRDMSFVATLRALVAPRMKDGETLTFRYCTSSYSKSQLDGAGDSTKKSLVTHLADCSSVIHLHEFNSFGDDDNKAWIDYIEKNFCNDHPGFVRLDKVTAFFKKAFDVVCFISAETRCVQLFTTRLDLRKFHYLQCGVFAFLPWYFDPKDGVSELEMELINSLREKTQDKYLATISRIAEQYDFRTKKIEMMLKGFETVFEQREIENVNDEIRRVNNKIDEYNSAIGGKLRELRDLQIRQFGLQMKINESSGESEIMDYFLCSKSLELISVEGTRVSFGVRQYLTFFDEDAARSAIENNRSYIYSYDGSLPQDDLVRLMRAIFLDGDLKLKVCAAYELDMFGGVNAIEHYDFGTEYRGYTPNTHIQEFACMGNYRQTINECLKDHQYIQAIEQCIASCKSLNFLDSTVMGKFIRDFYNDFDGVSCVELPDGSSVTPVQAAAYLKEQEEKDNG